MKANSVGTEQLTKCVDFLGDGVNCGEKMIKDPGNVLAKMSHLMELMPDMMNMGSLTFAGLKAELDDLDGPEKLALAAEFGKKLALPETDLVAKLTDGVMRAVKLEIAIQDCVEYITGLRAPVAAPAPATPAPANPSA